MIVMISVNINNSSIIVISTYYYHYSRPGGHFGTDFGLPESVQPRAVFSCFAQMLKCSIYMSS